MTTVQDRPAVVEPAASPLEGRAGVLLVRAALAVCAAGVVAGLFSGPLWLDETLSVEIARLPLPELFEALRRDGSPPLYYLLLHAWMALVGTGTTAVRMLTVLMVPLALLLAHRLGGRLAGVTGARAAVVALAVLPWTLRFASETRMYLMVVVLVLAGALALLEVRSRPSPRAVAALAACCGALLLSHYWALFLLTAVGLLHLPGLLRREPAAQRVAVAGVAGALLFLPWLPSFLFQAANTGAPWASAPGVVELLRIPRYWGGGRVTERTVFAAVLVPLLAVAVVRSPVRGVLRWVLGLVGLTLLLAWVQTAVMGGAFAPRYTAVVVPLVALVVGLGAAALPGTRWPVVGLAALVALGAVSGVRAAAAPRTNADDVARAFAADASRGDVLVYCPDQLGPPVQRELGSGYTQVVYPDLSAPQRIDWVGYAERNDAADPREVSARIDAMAAGRDVYVLKASGYRTYDYACNDLLVALQMERGVPERVFGGPGATAQQLYRYDG
jgi:4-amino-4-deoxy-L-arabinose transferase-like glycosyltransferase